MAKQQISELKSKSEAKQTSALCINQGPVLCMKTALYRSNYKTGVNSLSHFDAKAHDRTKRYGTKRYSAARKPERVPCQRPIAAERGAGCTAASAQGQKRLRAKRLALQRIGNTGGGRRLLRQESRYGRNYGGRRDR